MFNQQQQQQQESGGNGVAEGKCNNTNGENKDIPLDMSIRHRGQPPSYAQTISNPGYRSSYRPSVIQNGVPQRDDIPSGTLVVYFNFITQYSTILHLNCTFLKEKKTNPNFYSFSLFIRLLDFYFFFQPKTLIFI